MNMEFAKQVRDNITGYLPPEYREADVTLEEVTKGNDLTLTGLVIKNEGEAIVPTIYLEPYANEYEQGRPMDEIMREIAQSRTEHGLKLPFEVSELKDYDRAKPLLAIRLFDPELNQEYMKGKPFTLCGNLAAQYRLQLMEGSEGTASAIVVHQVLEQFGYGRMFYVLANTVRQKEWDGRISHDNKAWAKTIPVFENPDGFGHDRNVYFVVDRSHPGLTDLFLTQARKEYALSQEKKPSVRDSLNKSAGQQAGAEKQKQHRQPER